MNDTFLAVTIDNFLDKKDQAWILTNKQELMHSVPGATYRWCEGWWEKDPQNIQEKFIKLIHTKYNPLAQIDVKYNKMDIKSFASGNYTEIAGIEYWANDYNSDKGGSWHVNCDEKVKHESGQLITPPLSFCYYLTAPTSGGELKISSLNALEHPDANDYEINCSLIKPLVNRLVILDPSYWHRVMPFPKEETRATFLHDLWNLKIGTADAPNATYTQQ